MFYTLGVFATESTLVLLGLVHFLVVRHFSTLYMKKNRNVLGGCSENADLYSYYITDAGSNTNLVCIQNLNVYS